jgi:hypothetical protein
VRIVWPDGHESVYDKVWLRANSYDPQLPMKNPVVEKRAKRLWNVPTISKNLPVVQYKDIMAGDEGLATWLRNIVSIFSLPSSR